MSIIFISTILIFGLVAVISYLRMKVAKANEDKAVISALQANETVKLKRRMEDRLEVLHNEQREEVVNAEKDTGRNSRNSFNSDWV